MATRRVVRAERELAREGRAIARHIRLSPFKVRRVCDMIRNQPLPEARRLLAFTPLRSAATVSKVLESAVANAVNNTNLDEDSLYVHAVFADEGPTWKRWTPAAYGRAYRIRKRTAHITVVVREKKVS